MSWTIHDDIFECTSNLQLVILGLDDDGTMTDEQVETTYPLASAIAYGIFHIRHIIALDGTAYEADYGKGNYIWFNTADDQSHFLEGDEQIALFAGVTGYEVGPPIIAAGKFTVHDLILKKEVRTDETERVQDQAGAVQLVLPFPPA